MSANPSKSKPADNDPIFNLFATCLYDAVTLCIIAANPDRVDTARELYEGNYNGCDEGDFLASAGLCHNWTKLCRLDTTGYEDLEYWEFLCLVIRILADSKPEKGWRTAWSRASKQLRELQPETDSSRIWADLRERQHVLRVASGSPPVISLLKAESQPKPSGTTAHPKVDLSRMTITVDATSYDVKSINALRWVKVLSDHPGEWISSTELNSYDPDLDGCRTDRLLPMLPDLIKNLIDTQTGRGSRLRL